MTDIVLPALDPADQWGATLNAAITTSHSDALSAGAQATQAATDASVALTTANAAQSAAQAAQTAAQQAETDAQTAQTSSDGVRTDLTTLQGTVANLPAGGGSTIVSDPATGRLAIVDGEQHVEFGDTSMDLFGARMDMATQVQMTLAGNANLTLSLVRKGLNVEISVGFGSGAATATDMSAPLNASITRPNIPAPTTMDNGWLPDGPLLLNITDEPGTGQIQLYYLTADQATQFGLPGAGFYGQWNAGAWDANAFNSPGGWWIGKTFTYRCTGPWPTQAP